MSFKIRLMGIKILTTMMLDELVTLGKRKLAFLKDFNRNKAELDRLGSINYSKLRSSGLLFRIEEYLLTCPYVLLPDDILAFNPSERISVGVNLQGAINLYTYYEQEFYRDLQAHLNDVTWDATELGRWLMEDYRLFLKGKKCEIEFWPHVRERREVVRQLLQGRVVDRDLVLLDKASGSVNDEKLISVIRENVAAIREKGNIKHQSIVFLDLFLWAPYDQVFAKRLARLYRASKRERTFVPEEGSRIVH